MSTREEVAQADLECYLEEIKDLSQDISETARLVSKLREAVDTSLLERFNGRVARIDAAFERFLNVYNKALKSHKLFKLSTSELEILKRETRSHYYDILSFKPPSQTETFNNSFETSNHLSQTIAHIPTPLPTIQLPHFNGDINAWPAFKDTFISLIHENPDLDQTRKFQYLKTSLSGTAEQAISALKLTSSDYNQAWEILKKRFDNKRLLANNYLTKIFNYPPVVRNDVASLDRFSATVVESAQAFRNLDFEDPAGFILYTFALRLLDNQLKCRFESEFGKPEQIPCFSDFAQFIHQQSLQLQTNSMTSCSPSHGAKHPSRVPKSILTSLGVSAAFSLCPLCHQDHKVIECKQFRSLSPSERLQRIKSLGRCINCFSSGHFCAKCPSNYSCRHCYKKHHSLLHFNNPSYVKTGLVREPQTSNLKAGGSVTHVSTVGDKTPVLTASATGASRVILGTAVARIQDSEKKWQTIRMLIDSGSQRSFITTACAQRLKLPIADVKSRLVGLGSHGLKGVQGQIKCVIIPAFSNGPRVCTKAIIIKKICGNMPSGYIPMNIKSHFSNVDLADHSFCEPGRIDFLLGADLFGDILLGKLQNIPSGLPSGLKTIFGAVIMGQVDTPSSPETSVFLSTLDQNSKNENLDELLSRFWSVEEVPSVQKTNPKDIRCEDHFVQTHSRNPDGRYVVELPFEDKPVYLGDSYRGALTRLLHLERRFSKNPDYKMEYDFVFKDYLSQKFMSPTKQTGQFVLPHHGVTKEGSSKIRIVFDGSHRTSHGSLNEKLLTGPKLQLEIKDVLLNFRTHRIAMATDITQMYSQIVVAEKDRKYQHLLYRFNVDAAVSEYEFNRLPFGLSCSPYLALRVLRQLVHDEGEKYPRASLALRQHIYVDDILTGADTIEEALLLQQEIVNLLNKGGFSLKGWNSNAEHISPRLASDPVQPVLLSNLEDTTVKVLGMQWEPQSDCLSYRVQPLDENLIFTKRGILSRIARMYDPLGYMAPVVFQAKCLLQRLWELRLDWDDPIPPSMRDEWNNFHSNLHSLSSVSLPRFILNTDRSKIIVLGFADASSLGYAAVLYLLVEDEPLQVNLLYAKTRLAPLKPLTIPRLELCAVMLLITALKSLDPLLKTLNNPDVYLFTDSATVLSWLHLPYHRLKTFVANRVAKIRDAYPLSYWYHVRSQDNAADIASRGTDPVTLTQQMSWWNGPDWIRTPRVNWPITPYTSDTPSSIDLPETRTINTLLACQNLCSPEEFLDRFSSYSRMLRVMSYVLRFGCSFRKLGRHRNFGCLTVKEIEDTTLKLIKLVQQTHFTEKSALIKSAQFKSLSPYLDPLGIIRVGGRLRYAPLDPDTKNPILLPSKSRFVSLLIDEYHLQNAHAGPQLLLSLLRQRYWIMSGRRVVRYRVHQCLKCHRFRAKPITPFMGNLPPTRFEQGRPFLNVGVDFAGPFLIRESSRRKAALGKAYIGLFICFATKAVHIEVVSRLSTDCFLAALDRFVSRRGLPSKIFSDNGTNFVGASRQLKELYSWMGSEEVSGRICNHLLVKRVTWHFIPPGSPHFGGLWEAGVKSLKFHLIRILGQQPLTFEELSSAVIRIEAILNSRPLYPLSSSPEDFSVLTPGHFLVGDALVSLPEPDWTDSPINSLSRWQFIQRSCQDLWKRWRLDYLTCLQHRSKWTDKPPNLKPGTLVLIKDSSSPPLSWPTARVVEQYPGEDGIVRVVKVKTPTGQYVRPVSRLIPLFPQPDAEHFGDGKE